MTDYKKLLAWACIGLAALLIFIGALVGTIVSNRAAARALLAVEAKRSAQFEEQVKALRADAAQAHAAADKAGEVASRALARADAEAEARRKAAAAEAEAQAKLKDAPPETLVAEARRILETTEVWYRAGAGTVELSLPAFRLATTRLHDWEDFTLIREPAYVRAAGELRASIAAKTAEASSLRIENLRLEGIVKLKDEQYAGLKDTLGATSKLAFVPWLEKWSGRALWSAAGFAIGTLLERARGNRARTE